MIIEVKCINLKPFQNVTAARAGAAENRGGAGEHPRVCEDEEQPAQDQAGGRWRGANHLKTSRGVWVWLIVRVFVSTESSEECVYESRESVWWQPDRGPR